MFIAFPWFISSKVLWFRRETYHSAIETRSLCCDTPQCFNKKDSCVFFLSFLIFLFKSFPSTFIVKIKFRYASYKKQCLRLDIKADISIRWYRISFWYQWQRLLVRTAYIQTLNNIEYNFYRNYRNRWMSLHIFHCFNAWQTPTFCGKRALFCSR